MTILAPDSTSHSLYGPAAGLTDYGPGRRCPSETCHHAILRHDNPGPLCSPCRDEARSRDLTADSRTHAVMTSSELWQRCPEALELLRDKQWWTARLLADQLGVSKEHVRAMVMRLRELGNVFESHPGVGTRLTKEAPMPSEVVVRHFDPATGLAIEEKSAPTLADIKASIAASIEKSAPAASTGAGCESGVNPDLHPPAFTMPPFAGLVVSNPYSPEVRIICELEQLDEVARCRVLGYATSKWQSG